MAEVDYNKMQEAFERALRAKGVGGGSGGFSTPTGPSTAGAGITAIASAGLKKGFEEAGGAAKGLAGSFGDIAGKLVTGGVRISDVTKALEGNFKEAGFAGSTLAKALGGMSGVVGEVVKYVEEGVDSFRELSKTGASFNNSIIELRSNAAQTRMTLAEYGDVVKNNSSLFTTFGGTVSQGAKQFTEFSKKFFDSPVADELRLMGYNTKDLNELLALQTTTMKINGKLDEAAMKREIEAARNLAVEMDTVAKLTGISRKEQEDKLRKDRENGQMMAAIDLAMMKGGKDVQKAFDGMTTAASMGGKDFQRLQQEIFAMGRPSQEMSDKFSMIGGEAQKLMTQAAEAAKKGNTEQAKMLTQQAAAAAANASGSETFMNLAAQGSKDFGDLAIQLRKNKVQLEDIAKAEGLDLNTTEGLAKANQIRLDQVKAEQKSEQDNIAKSAILAEARAKDTYTAINNALVKPLADEVNPALKGFADKLRQANTVPGGFRGTAEKAIETGKEKVKEIVAPVAQAAQRVQDRNTPGPGPAQTQPLTEQETQQATAARQTGGAYRQGREAANRPVSPVGGEVPQRNEGSLAAAGKIFENWGSGTLVELHGMESVMRPEDLEKIVGSSLGAVKKSMAEVSSKATTKNSSSFDISKISKDISTTISSSSGGGASTVKGPSPADMANPIGLSKAFLKDSQKAIFDEFIVLNNDQAKVRKEQLNSELEGAKAVNKAAGKARDEIEERYEKEGKLAELKHDEEFKQLGKVLNSSYDQIRASEDAIKAAARAVDAKKNAEKLGYEIVVETGKKTADNVRATQEQVKLDIIEALPVKELEGTLAEAAKTLDDHGKTTLKYAMRDSDEQIAMYKSTAVKSLELNKKSIEENNSKIAELEEKGKTQELSAREKNRIQRLKTENDKLQEGNKFREQEVAAYTIAEEEKKKALTTTVANISSATQELLVTGRAVSEETAKNLGTVDDSEMGGFASNQSFGSVDDSEMGGFASNQSFGSVDDSEMGGFATQPQNFGSVDDSEMGGFATQKPPSVPTIPSIDLSSLNLPGFGPSIKSAAATVAPAVNKPVTDSDTARENARFARQAEQAKKSEADAAPARPPASTGKATLDDVVKELAMLNTKIASLTEETKQIGSKQERATRASSQNIYQR